MLTALRTCAKRKYWCVCVNNVANVFYRVENFTRGFLTSNNMASSIVSSVESSKTTREGYMLQSQQLEGILYWYQMTVPKSPLMEALNRNGRKPRKANHGKRPCSNVRRRSRRPRRA